MKSSILILLTVLFLSAAAASAAKNILVLQWPPSFCSDPGYCKPELVSNQFLIHGQHHAGSQCLGGEFDETALASVEQDLRSARPALEREDDDVRFWKYEWENHGAYAYPPMLIDEYFGKAVALSKSRKFEQDLEKAGILFGKSYTPAEFHENLQKVYLHPQAICKPGTKKDEFLLVELRYCVNEAATKILPPCFYI